MATAATVVTADLLGRIEAFVEKAVRRQKLPGLAVVVVEGSQTLLARGFGSTALRAGRPVTADTLFQIGSVTKSMTALAVLQLRDQGLIDLDAPVQRYLPWFALADRETSSRITVRHLLYQTSGIPYGAHKVAFAGTAVRNSLEQAVRALRLVKPNGPPGARSEYANMNYATLGLLVETATGKEYRQYMREALFAPLGMERATFDAGEAQRLGHMHGHAREYGQGVAIPAEADAFCAPAGLALFASAGDLARYLALQLGAEPGGLISPASLAEGQAGAVDTQVKGVRYGMGWMSTDLHGAPLVFHAGITAGFNAMVALLPRQGLGVAVLSGLSGAHAEQISTGVLRLLLGHEPSGPDLLPDLNGVITGVGNGLLVVGGLSLVGLLLFPAQPLPAWLAWALTALTLMLGLMPRALKRSYAFPLPVPVGHRGWPLELIVGYWALWAGIGAWALYGLLFLLA